MSTFEPGRTPRADARRNAENILDAAAELTALDPATGLERIAARAGVSRATLYHHFASRDALLDALTDRSIAEVHDALTAAQPEHGPPDEAMMRALIAAWQVIGRYRGLIIINPRRLERSVLRRRMGPALAPIRELIERGQCDGDFDAELSTDWLISAIIDLVHLASRNVSSGTMTPQDARRSLLRSTAAVLTSHRRSA